MKRMLVVILLLVGGPTAGVFAERYAADARNGEYVVKFMKREKEYPTVCHSGGDYQFCRFRRMERVGGEYVPMSD